MTPYYATFSLDSLVLAEGAMLTFAIAARSSWKVSSGIGFVKSIPETSAAKVGCNSRMVKLASL